MERPEDRVALIEWLERDGHVQRSVDVAAWPLSLGRALDNTVVLDDPHVAAHHARVETDASGRLQLHALPSRNGVKLDGKPVTATALLPAAGALLQLGTTRLRLRLRAEIRSEARAADAADAEAAPAVPEPLAPEKPLPDDTAGGLRAPLLAGLCVLLLALADQWVTLDPGADYTAWLPTLLGVPLALAVWCGFWALLSKLFQHRFDFAGHLRIALPWLLVMALVSTLWPQLAAALALPRMWQASGLVNTLLTALLLHAHLRQTLPQHRRAVTTVVATVVIAGIGLQSALTWRRHDSLVAMPYMSTLPVPGLRLSGTLPSAELVQDMAPLAGQLAARVEQARKDEEKGVGEDEPGE